MNFDDYKEDDIETEGFEPNPAPGLSPQQLFESCIPWAYRYANTYIQEKGVPKGCQQEDVWQAALMGTWESTQTYNSSKGRFSTWSAWHMRKHINELVGVSSGVVHHSKRPKYRPSLIRVELEKMRQEGLEPTFSGACDRLGIPESRRETLRAAYELKRKKFEGIEKWNEPSNGIEDGVVGLIAEQEVAEREGSKLAEAFAKLPEVIQEILSDQANGVKQYETEARLGISRPTFGKYRKLGLEWMRYFMGLHEDPPETPLPHMIRKRKRRNLGTAVPTLEDKDCA